MLREDGAGSSDLLTPIMTHVKLHIPGPVEVSAKTFSAFCTPMIGHRGQGFKDLYAKIQPQLQQLLFTRQLVYLSTSSAWGVMEGAVRNLVHKRVLNCMCGAFSDKWFDVSKRCGKEAEALQVPWGSPIRPEQVEAKLATGQFDAITLIHNETSTGVMSPIYEIAALKKKFPDVTFIVDAVSSMSAVKLEFDALGIDVLLAGVQKAFALPPGLAVFVCCRGPGGPVRPPPKTGRHDARLGRPARVHPFPRTRFRVRHAYLCQQWRQAGRPDAGGRAQAAKAGQGSGIFD